ncbi:hypothetical protein L1987_64101 [Smallanthus sonchifolius]|uniref:Uncharacterized protein n=1 Tax=Smallanthus sonchifolius TaxID=185202 RepID=A0ACB9CF42_9ASTR|nr:hypothetical protein L1987_64101 [Smallanthus sonchifolius]
MYGHSPNNDTYSFSTNFLAISRSVPLHPPPYELDSVYDSPRYTSSPRKEIQRSGSSHSIATQFYNSSCFSVSSPTELLDSEGSSSAAITRVFSAGDLQGTSMKHSHYHRSESSLSSESNTIIESMNKACRYSPNEKKERIERYRCKKTQRNFNKKIKYECRKTLADSRSRIRGRFARNDETQTIENQYKNHGDVEEGIDYEDVDDRMKNFLDSFTPNLIP